MQVPKTEDKPSICYRGDSALLPLYEGWVRSAWQPIDLKRQTLCLPGPWYAALRRKKPISKRHQSQVRTFDRLAACLATADTGGVVFVQEWFDFHFGNTAGGAGGGKPGRGTPM